MNTHPEISRPAARIAGSGLLLMALLGFYGEFFVRSRLLDLNDLPLTLQNLSENPLLFRSSIATDLMVIVLDIVVALSLYQILRVRRPDLSLLAAGFRLVYSAIYAVAVMFHVLVAHMPSTAPDTMQLLLLNGYQLGWQVGLVFFGFHLLLLGLILVTGKTLPGWIGVLLVLAGLGYLIDAFAHLLLTDYAAYKPILLPMVAVPGILSELSLCGWLLVQGFRRKQPDSTQHLPAT